MERMILPIVYVALVLLVALTGSFIFSGKEPSTQLIALIGSLLGGVVARAFLSRRLAGGSESEPDPPASPSPVLPLVVEITANPLPTPLALSAPSAPSVETGPSPTEAESEYRGLLGDAVRGRDGM